MKPEARGCWRSRAAWSIRLAGLTVVLGLVLSFAGCTGEGVADGGAASARLVRAKLLSVAGQGFTPPPARVDVAFMEAGDWHPVALPYTVVRQIAGQPSGQTRTQTDWYQLDPSGLDTMAEPTYLYIPRWKTVGLLAVYGDGQLLYQSGGSVVYNDYNHPLLLQLNGAAGVPPPKKLLLRIDRLQSTGSALSAIWVGAQRPLVWRYQMRLFLQNQLPFVGSAAFLALGIFSLFIWFKRRVETLYLLFFAISALAFVRMLHYYVGGAHLPISDAWFQWMTVSSLMWLFLLVNSFMERLHQRALPWLTPFLTAIALVSSLLTLPGVTTLLPDLMLVTPLLYLLMLPFAVLVSSMALRQALLTRSREVWLMAGWFVVTIVLSAYDLALQNNWVGPEGMYTNPYGIIGLFVMFGYIIFKRYIGAIAEVEQVNAGLAQRLQAREADLAATYERMSKIEHKQTLSDERQRLMQDMHDGLGSTLISAIRSVEGGGMTDTKVTQILKDCMDDLKLAIDSMEPVEADLLLLLATLRFRLEPRLEGTDIELVWQVQELPVLDWLEPSSALHILRIVQESIANVLRHTRATQIQVATAVVGDGVQVSITDNGQGFDLEKAITAATGKGLINQKRRAQMIGAKVRWGAAPGGGTCFTLWLPLARSQIST